MPLRDYEPLDHATDHFQLPDGIAGSFRNIDQTLVFPCCLCTHNRKNAETSPCCHCGHNSMAADPQSFPLPSGKQP